MNIDDTLEKNIKYLNELISGYREYSTDEFIGRNIEPTHRVTGIPLYKLIK